MFPAVLGRECLTERAISNRGGTDGEGHAAGTGQAGGGGGADASVASTP